MIKYLSVAFKNTIKMNQECIIIWFKVFFFLYSIHLTLTYSAISATLIDCSIWLYLLGSLFLDQTTSSLALMNSCAFGDPSKKEQHQFCRKWKVMSLSSVCVCDLTCQLRFRERKKHENVYWFPHVGGSPQSILERPLFFSSQYTKYTKT